MKKVLIYLNQKIKGTFFLVFILLICFLHLSFKNTAPCQESRLFPVDINTSKFKCVNSLVKNNDFQQSNSEVYTEWKRYKNDSLIITSIYYNFKKNECLSGFKSSSVSFRFCNDKLFETQHVITFTPDKHLEALDTYNNLIKGFKISYKYYQNYNIRHSNSNEDTGEMYEFASHDLNRSNNLPTDVRIQVHFNTQYSTFINPETYNKETKLTSIVIYINKNNSACQYYNSQ